MSPIRKVFLCSLGSLMLLASQAQPTSAAMFMFQDDTFLNTDWVATKWADTTPGALASFGATQLPTGGSTNPPNTPPYRSVSHTYNAGAIQVEHRNVTFNWTPLPGESVTDIDYFYDLRHHSFPTIGGAVGYGLNIYQGGNIYRSTLDNIFADAWTPISHLVVPLTSFGEVLPGSGLVNSFSNPNGSAAMSFGYMSANSANQLANKRSGIDNLKIVLWTVPEPATATCLTSVFLVALGLFRRVL